MQVGILRQIQGAEAVTAKVAEVLRVARGAGIRVFFFRHRSLPKELMGVFQLRMAMAWQRVGSVDEVKPWFLRDSRHGADLGYTPIVVTDACGAGHPEAGERALASLRYLGDALFADVTEIRDLLSTTGGPPYAAPRR
jgi:nicotinamidase-related amidase